MNGLIIKVLGPGLGMDEVFNIEDKVPKGSLYYCNYREANNVLKLKQRDIGAIVAIMKTDYNEYKPYKYFKLKGKLVEQGYMMTQQKILQDYRQQAEQQNSIKMQNDTNDAELEYQKSQEVLKQIPIEDLDNSDISRYFFETAKWIEQKRRQGKNVLVHCVKGQSRSPTIILAYLMITNKEKVEINNKVFEKNWTLEKAQKYLKDITKNFNPNEGFMSQLQELERFLDIDFKNFENAQQSGLDLSILETSILKNQIIIFQNVQYQINYNQF